MSQEVYDLLTLLVYRQAFQIETFATKVGVGRIANGATFLLFLNYMHAMATGLLAKPGVLPRVKADL